MKEVAAIDRAIDELLVQLGQMVLRLSSPQVTKRADERRALIVVIWSAQLLKE